MCSRANLSNRVVLYASYITDIYLRRLCLTARNMLLKVLYDFLHIHTNRSCQKTTTTTHGRHISHFIYMMLLCYAIFIVFVVSFYLKSFFFFTQDIFIYNMHLTQIQEGFCLACFVVQINAGVCLFSEKRKYFYMMFVDSNETLLKKNCNEWNNFIFWVKSHVFMNLPSKKKSLTHPYTYKKKSNPGYLFVLTHT